MKQSLKANPNAMRMLQRIPQNIQDTFSPIQIQAIEEALVPRTHNIDIRLLMPFLGKGAYLVFAAGPNKRKGKRLNATQRQLEMSKVLSHVINISEACRKNPHAYQLLSRVPKDIITTFTPAQIQAMEVALIPRSHVIDIRISMPLLGKGAYLVFAAGPNKRSHYRNLQNRNPFVIPAIVACATVGAATLISLVYLRSSGLLASSDPKYVAEETFYPTVVPFKRTRGECVESGRQWVDGQCIDHEHDPTF